MTKVSPVMPAARSLGRLVATSVVAAALVLGGCAAQRLHRQGLDLVESGRYEEGIALLEEAVKVEPRDATYRFSLATTRDSAALNLLTAAERELLAGNVAAARLDYQRVLAIQPQNSRAIDGLRTVERQEAVDQLVETARQALARRDLEAAQKAVDAGLAANPKHVEARALRDEIAQLKLRQIPATPRLKSSLSKPVSLEFRDANLKTVFEILARTGGINFIFDKEVKPDLKATIFVRQVPIEDAVELLLIQNQLLKKVINDNTILIYPDTPQKLREFQDLSIKTFYLSNADAKQALNLIKTILKTRDVFIDEKLNVLIMRDTPDAIRLAEMLLASVDLAEPEVVLEIEVLELSRNKLLDLGVQWPSQLSSPSDVQRPGTGVGDIPPVFDPLRQTVKNFKNTLRIDSFLVDRAVVIKALNTDADSRQLASPRIRVRSKEKARIHIGDKVPVVTATVTGASGANPIVTDTIQYLDVGIKLDVEPTVYLNDEVAIRLNLDVSSASTLPATQNGSVPVQVSTRNATTMLRLRDGETQALAGLIQNTRSLNRDKVPGLGDIPILGTLFSTNRNDDRNTELVLLITPRVVRNLERGEIGLAEAYSGTDGGVRTRPVMSAALAPVAALPTTSVDVVPGTASAVAQPEPPAAAAAPASLTLAWDGPTELKPGEEATFVLQADAAQPLRSTTFQVAWDPAAVKVVEVSEGDLLRQDGATTAFSPRHDEAAGRLFVAASRSAPTGASGAGVLVRLRVIALEPQGEATPLRLLSFSAVGQSNRLLAAPLPAPFELTVAP